MKKMNSKTLTILGILFLFLFFPVGIVLLVMASKRRKEEAAAENVTHAVPDRPVQNAGVSRSPDGHSFSVSGGGVVITGSVSSSLDRWGTAVQPTSEEAPAVEAIFSALGDLAPSFHCERHGDSYLSILGPAEGSDFCRLHVGARSSWISLDAWTGKFDDDPRLAGVANKKQRHWKISLADVSDIAIYADLIYRTAAATLSQHETA